MTFLVTGSMRYLYSLLSTAMEVLRSFKRHKIALEQQTADCRKSIGANPGRYLIFLLKKNLHSIPSDYSFPVNHSRVIVDPRLANQFHQKFDGPSQTDYGMELWKLHTSGSPGIINLNFPISLRFTN